MPTDTEMVALGWGRHDAAGYEAAHIVTLTRHGVALRVRREAGPAFASLLDALVRRKGQGWLVHRTDDWGYADRPIRGGTEPSYHAWGLAVDINAQTNPSRPTRAGGTTDMPAGAARLARRRGMVWGGTWHEPYDPMHYEVHDSRIEAVQRALGWAGQPVVIDGSWGPQTRAAIRAVQKAHRLPVTGELDGRTWRALIPPAPG